MTTGWILVIALSTTSGKFVEKVSIGPFTTKQQCMNAKIEGLNRFKLDKVCVSSEHFNGRKIDDGVALD